MSDPAQSNAPSAAAASSPPQDDDEISLLDLLIVLANHKKLILGLPMVVAVLAAGFSLLIPNIYTATTRILPPQSQSSASALLAQQLGGLAGLAGAAGIKNPSDLYVGMLRSRTVADNLIQRFDLNKVYEQRLQSNTRSQLESNTVITPGKDGIISIHVDDKDPKQAAEIANAYVEELFKLTKVLAVTEASQRRLFFERQLAEAKDSLVASEATARQALETGGLVQVEGQGRALAEITARLRGQITVKEVQIGAMRTFASDRNPDLRLAQQELESLKRELAKFEGTSERPPEGRKAGKSEGLNSVGLLRNVKYHETIYELLAKQFELSKIDEARDSAVVQVMDRALEPDRKSKPKRLQIVILVALVTGVLVVIFALARHAIRNTPQDTPQAERFRRLRLSLRINRRS
jgi:tyrosine-protein kinase Etk/Wzc